MGNALRPTPPAPTSEEIINRELQRLEAERTELTQQLEVYKASVFEACDDDDEDTAKHHFSLFLMIKRRLNTKLCSIAILLEQQSNLDCQKTAQSLTQTLTDSNAVSKKRGEDAADIEFELEEATKLVADDTFGAARLQNILKANSAAAADGELDTQFETFVRRYRNSDPKQQTDGSRRSKRERLSDTDRETKYIQLIDSRRQQQILTCLPSEFPKVPATAPNPPSAIYTLNPESCA